MKTAFAAAFLIVLLALSCAYCAIPPPSEPTIAAHLGGPGWRVFDAELVDSAEATPTLLKLHTDAATCSGSLRPYNEAEVYLTSKIMVKSNLEWTAKISGLTVGHRIYVRRDLTPIYVRNWVIKHEFVHFNTDLSHPVVDKIMEICNVSYQSITEVE